MSRKREDLLVHAEKLFYEHGFHAIGLKAIVQDAGVALMTLYNHFDSKEDLILEILNRREKMYFSMLKDAVRKEEGSIEHKLVSGHIQWLKTSASNGCMFLRAKEEFSSIPDHPLVKSVYSHKEKMIQFFESNEMSRTAAVQLALLLEGSTSLAETLNVQEIEKTLYAMVENIKNS
ncbi:TetR family transcriptional regulator [Sinobaca qinghaiensis]|uniref:TetR family transcriptional regulator n=1 Tax=Sinobaca qinghaiensis TaxID=342944 RepID=A0A419UX41_9BACL|nr:TetR/AcrR family transcriptional regulator [Sinobaca qinghaiensis]RKD69691.1 TetR family transcriptional regulator [Sinobaca qinghaiensis]